MGEDGPRRYGVTLGTVRDTNDPEQRGRLKVLVPKIHTTRPLPMWVPMLGQSVGLDSPRGTFVVPEVGATVAVMFLDGDPEQPVWLPGPLLAAAVDPAVKSSARATRDRYPKKSLLARGRNVKVLELERGELEITSGDTRLTLNATGRTIEVTASGAQVLLTAEGALVVSSAAGQRIDLQGATQSFLRGDDFVRDLGVFLDALLTAENALAAALGAVNTWAGAVQPTADPLGAATATLTAALTTTLASAMAAFSGAKQALATALPGHLSTRLKGE